MFRDNCRNTALEPLLAAAGRASANVTVSRCPGIYYPLTPGAPAQPPPAQPVENGGFLSAVQEDGDLTNDLSRIMNESRMEYEEKTREFEARLREEYEQQHLEVQRELVAQAQAGDQERQQVLL